MTSCLIHTWRLFEVANKLSHSNVTKYQECGFAYKLHYIDKIRPIAEPSTLTFGGCVDKAFSAMLVPGEKTPEAIFLEEWEKAYGNNPNATFSKSDLDEELANTPQESLKQKGLLMLKALREQILPQIETVYSVQEPITLENQDESGDSVIGFIDLVVKLKGYDKPIIMDLKTSSVVYKPDSVKESQQLTLYTYAVGEKYKTNLAGFIVLNKKIRKTRTKKCQSCGASFLGSRLKTCSQEVPFVSPVPMNVRCNGELIETTENSVDTQIIVDEVSPEAEDKVLNTLDTTLSDIRAEKFEQNPNSCIHPIFRTKCPYYDLCHNDSMAGLFKKEDT